MHASAILISDLHLTPSMPRTAERFFEFLEKEARSHEALIILGDLFEFWVGDDAKARSPFHQAVAKAIKALSQSGTKVYFMPGNRDFLLGQQYAQKAQMSILNDPQVMVIAEQGQSWERWVLSDWDFDHPETVLPKGNALSITSEGIRSLDLVRA